MTRPAFAPVAIAPLVWFRVAFGAIMLVEVGRYFAHDWIGRYFIEPDFMFKYFGFGWVRPWPGEGMKLHFFALGVLAMGVMLGIRYRLAAALLFLGFTYVFFLDQARYLNHFYLVCLYSFLLAVVPAHRAFSWDAWRQPAQRGGTAPAWSLWLLRAQICAVYFFGGIAKLNRDWLQGEPMHLWLARRANYPVLGTWFTHDSAAYFFSYAGVLFDLGIVPLLLWRRTRWWAFGAAALFNLTNGWIFQIGIFPWLVLGATVLLFAPRLPQPLASLWQAPAPVAAVRSTRHGLTIALVAAYLAGQFLFPLRHWLYAGDVLWTEEGHRFSWHMKLRSKSASLTLYAHDPDTNRTWKTHLPNYINRAQLDEAAGRPDMILQLAHRVAEDFRRQGHPHIQVRARALVSLNGRVDQLLVDPDVDLAAQPRTLGSATWITPLTTPLSARQPPRSPSTPSPASSDG
ncbi:MAG: HTTM domain-containing protein [Opitutus sp.]|nr:HTTM domain-containing protein [Opitutus sp.]